MLSLVLDTKLTYVMVCLIEERKNNWPGIGREVSKICEELEISDINTNVVTKKEVDTAIKNLQIENLKKETDQLFKNHWQVLLNDRRTRVPAMSDNEHEKVEIQVKM